MTCFLRLKMSEISKHVFLEYGEYQRLLDAKRKSELLLLKVRELEQKLIRLEKVAGNQSGTGQNNLSGLIATKESENELESPLPGVLSSITLPPSASFSDKAPKKVVNWYFLGIP